MTNSSPDRSLEGQVALVTGSSRGIGAAIARALGARGAHVVLAARKAAGLEAVEDAIHQAGGSATIAPLDLVKDDSIARLASAVAQRWNRLDILVISAAQFPPLTPVTQISGKDLNTTFTLNVLATQALLAAFDPLLKRAPAGRIIGLTSSVGASPRPFWGAYGASKAAFDTLLACHGQEIARISNTRVAIIDPGATRTRMRELAYPGEDPQTVKPPEVVGERIAELATTGFDNLHRERIGPD